jgi:CHRD domain
LLKVGAKGIKERRIMRIGRALVVAVAVPLLLVAMIPQGLAAKKLSTTMTGAEEPGGGDADATGVARFRLNAGQKTVCFDLSWADIDGTVFAAHIHEAPPGEAGPAVVPLYEGEYAGTDSESACVTSTRALIKDIRATPSDYYVNVHSTPDFPAGAIRGQLGD